MLSIQTLSGKRLKKENPASSKPQYPGRAAPCRTGAAQPLVSAAIPSQHQFWAPHECSSPTSDLTEDHQKVPPAPTRNEVLLLPEAASAQTYLQDQWERERSTRCRCRVLLESGSGARMPTGCGASEDCRAIKARTSPAGTELTPGTPSALLPLPKPLARIRDSQETVQSQDGREKTFLMEGLVLGSRWASLLLCFQHWTGLIFPPSGVMATALPIFNRGRPGDLPARVAQRRC